MNPGILIAEAEYSFQKKLEAFFISEFDDRTLQSHGLDHHRRVWHYACVIIRTLDFTPPLPDRNFVSELILASYLHDIGMASDQGPRHGRASRESAERFILLNGLDSASFTNALSAIENHDNKEYNDSARPGMLLKVLSLADDLDALGYTGIYRYLEIYLKRGMKPAEAGLRIAENAASRFRFLNESMRKHRRILEVIENRYRILESFFREFNSCSLNYDFGRKDPEGNCGVADIILQINNGDTDLGHAIEKACREEPGKEIADFFKAFKNELDTPAFRS